MINPTAIARALKANLAAQDIHIKHVQALDLIAAGAGLANRHVMAQLPHLKPIQRVNIALLTSAATALALHDEVRREVIISEASTILRLNASSNEIIDFETHNLQISVAELDDAEAFLATDRGEAFVASIVSDLFYSRYERYQNDGPMSLKEGNALAEAILDAKREGKCVEQAMAEHFKFGYSPLRYWYDQAQSEVEAIIDKIIDEMDELEDGLEFEKWDFIHALENPILDKLEEADTSKPQDLIGSYDKFEAIFLLKAPGYDLDQMISSTKAWSAFDVLCVDDTLQHGLSRLGYSVAEYRRLSGNKLESIDLQRGLKKRSDRLVSPEQLQEIIDNACTQNFLFVVYAIVPIPNLIKLDLAKSMTFSNASIATYNPFSGTFHEVCLKRPVTLAPKEGVLRCGSEGVSPDDICGFYTPVFYADLENDPRPTASRRLALAA
jgi:hypothetical protein